MKNQSLRGGERDSLETCLLGALVLALSSPFSTGSTYFVDGIYGNDTNAGTTLGRAKASIQAAVNTAATADTVLVSAGVYSMSATLTITKAITVKSLNGAHSTVIDGGYPDRRIRCVRISNQLAILDGFTIRNGIEGVYFDGESSGTIRSSIVTSIAGNGIVFRHGGRAHSCTVANNSGIGLYAFDMGGGGDPAVNLILHGNRTNLLFESNANIGCDHCFMEDPHFAGTDDFRLLASSPCIDKGTNRTWMTAGLAAQGNPRIGGAATDIGAYEFVRVQPTLNSANGHYYAYFPAQVTWPLARSLASSLSFNGWPGYLATITSQSEQDFIVRTLPNLNGFLGGSDLEKEGDWKWIDGPEANQLFFRGRYPASNRQTFIYSNWGSNEPNDYDNRPIVAPYPGEDYLAFSDPVFGKWNDVPGSPFTLPGFYVEFSSVPLAIAQQPIDVTLDRGQTAVFAVGASGGLPFQYQWYFNNVSLAGQTNSTLALQNVSTDAVGDYFVTVTNPSGDIVTSRTARLTVVAPISPAITQPPKDATVVWGETVTFTVAADGTLPFQYGWSFNGAAMPGQTNATLTLPNVTTNQAGAYTVTVSNRTGIAVTSAAARLTVDLPPPAVITQQPRSLTVDSGRSAVFTVVASGVPPLRYQWFFATNALAGETNAMLTLRNVTTNHAGNYSAVVNNPSGVPVSSQPARLTVAPATPPVITKQPVDLTVERGATATFTVEASGTTPLRFQWFMGTGSLAGQTNAALTLRNVATNQAGIYRVIVSNSAGSVSSANAVLVVNDPFLPPVNDPFANRTPLFRLSVSVTNSNANATREAGEPNHAGNSGGKSIWWSWTAPQNGNVTIGTAGSSVDTVLAVYTGTNLASLQVIASNDDDPAGGTGSIVGFRAQAGVAYQIAVDTFGGQAGEIRLKLTLEVERPVLRVALSGQNVVLSWPTNAVGFSLEVSDNLGTPVWTGVSTVPVVTAESYSLKLPLGNSSRFCRLKAP